MPCAVRHFEGNRGGSWRLPASTGIHNICRRTGGGFLTKALFIPPLTKGRLGGVLNRDNSFLWNINEDLL